MHSLKNKIGVTVRNNDNSEDAVNSFVNYGAVNERLDEMIARIEEDKNVH